jgi:hypothetical protein
MELAPSTYKAWTDADKQYLIDNYQTKTYREIAKETGHPIGAVGVMAYRLHLSKVKPKPEQPVESRIGTIIRPSPGVLIHYGKFPDDYRYPQPTKKKC